ncbi:hypothetical protein [Virgibacillus ainsalahensis]
MRELLPILFLILSIFAFIFNLFGLLQIIPLYFTLPLLFLSIYLTIYSFTHKRVYRGGR